jgi:hypothetical protein
MEKSQENIHQVVTSVHLYPPTVGENGRVMGFFFSFFADLDFHFFYNEMDY